MAFFHVILIGAESSPLTVLDRIHVYQNQGASHLLLLFCTVFSPTVGAREGKRIVEASMMSEGFSSFLSGVFGLFGLFGLFGVGTSRTINKITCLTWAVPAYLHNYIELVWFLCRDGPP